MPKHGSSRTYRCPPDHPHGLNGTCYAHGCGCDACVRHVRERSQSDRKANAYGRATTELVDAGPTIAKIGELRAAGWTYAEIADAAGVIENAPKRIVGKPVKRVKPATERAYLAIAERPARRAQAFVDPTGTRRRLQALARIGHSIPSVAERIGWGHRNLWALARGEHGCVEQSRALIAKVYDELVDTPPAEGLGKTRAQSAAIRAGWVGPDAWWGIDIDDPHANPLPDVGPSDADTAVLEELDHFHGFGESADQVAATLGRTRADLAALARWHRRRDLATWIAPPKRKTRAA